MKKTKNLYLLLALLTFLWTTSCSDNNDIITNSDNDNKVHWTIGVTLPGASKSESRAFVDGDKDGTGSDGYFEFTDLYVAVFEEVNGMSILDEFVKAEGDNAPEWDEENNRWKFGVSLSETDSKRRLHIIANYPGLTMGFGEEGQLVGRLIANGEDHDVYWNFVDVDMIAEGYEAQVQNVPLVRNYAKVVLSDSRTDKSNFTLTGYALYNVPIKGTVAAYLPKATKKFAEFVNDNGTCQSYQTLLNNEGYEGNEPYDDGSLLSTEINWIEPDDDGSFPPSYIYERSNRSANNPTCMLIRGIYDGRETYYKLDFVYDDTSAGTKVYYNLLRNFVFTMMLNRVTGPGYSTPQEALQQPASNNIGGDAVAEDFTNISNGTGRLFVSTTYMLLTKSQEAYLYYKYIPDLDEGTISNGGVTITAPAGDVLSIPAVVADSDETSGHYAGWRKLILTPNAIHSESKSQELLVAAGGLQRKVVLVLREPYNLSVDVDPTWVERVAKASLDVNITLPTGIPVSLFPLRLFISSEDNTIFPDYGTNMPAETLDGRYGFVKEVSLEEYNDSDNKVFVCDFLTTCAESATTVYVDNEYFYRGSDFFLNESYILEKGRTVTVEQESLTYDYIWERTTSVYPQKLHGGGTEEVTVKLGDQELATIYINETSITSDDVELDVTDMDLSTVISFTFKDKYCKEVEADWRGRLSYTWSTDEVEYKFECTLQELMNGITLDFTK